MIVPNAPGIRTQRKNERPASRRLSSLSQFKEESMRPTITPFALLTAAVLVCACFTQGQERSVSQQPSEPLAVDSQDVDNAENVVFLAFWEPMPVEILENISDPDYSWSWGISYRRVDPTILWSELVYEPEDGSLSCTDGVRYSYVFPSAQAFMDLVDYIAERPDTFFDYSEFEGAPPGEYILPEGCEEHFCFGVRMYGRPGDDRHDYCIAKGIVPGEPVPEEIQYVIDELRNLREELLQHPVEPGQGQQ